MNIYTTTTGRVLARLMREHGISQNELARLTKIPQPTIQRIISGESKEPRRSNLAKLAAYFGVPVAYLTSGFDNGRTANETPEIRRVKIIMWTNIVDWIDNPRQDEPPDNSAYTHATVPLSAAAFALTVSDDSMAGEFLPGAVIICDPSKAPTSGNYVIARETATSPPTFKQYIADGARCYLKPLNSAYPIIQCTDESSVLAVVVQQVRTYA